MLRKVISLLVVVLIMGFFQFVVAGRAMANECPVTGTMDNVVNAALKHLEPNLVDDCTRSAIQPGSAASLEMTTIGEEPQPIPNPGNPEMPYLRPGLIPFMSRQVAGLISTPPISSAEYVADVMHNFGVPGVGQAYAQTGIGFNALKPVLPIWKAFRNIAYALYVIIFIVIGFMIMFRAKINPQTVVTIQSALPNLVITLILITFSYAIAGFLVDLIYVGIYVAAYALDAGGVFNSAQTVIDRIMTDHLWGIMFREQAFVATAPARAITDLVENLFQGALGELFQWGAPSIAKLIIGVLLLIAGFKLFYVLGVGFINIILSVVIAPLQIMLNAIPGSQAFSGWFKGILANVVMFPAVAVLFMIAAALMGPVSTANTWGQSPGGVFEGTRDNPWDVSDGIGYGGIAGDNPFAAQWSPPLLMGRREDILGNPTTPQDNVSPMMVIIGLFAILISPQIAIMARDSIKKDGLNIGTAIGQSVGSGVGMAWAPVRMAREQSRAKRAARENAQMIGTAVNNPEAFR